MVKSVRSRRRDPARRAQALPRRLNRSRCCSSRERRRQLERLCRRQEGDVPEAIDVDSEAAYGLLGTAARAALPYIKDALAENARIDLKPFAANARTSIEAAIAEFRSRGQGVQVDAAVTELRLAGIEYDAKTLRIIAEAEGTAKVAISQLPGK